MPRAILAGSKPDEAPPLEFELVDMGVDLVLRVKNRNEGNILFISKRTCKIERDVCVNQDLGLELDDKGRVIIW